MVKATPALAADIDPKVMTFALKFLNTAPKEKLVVELDLAEAIANKVIDQRDFGGYKSLDDIFEKKLMRKKKFTVFRDKLLAFAKDNKPSDKPDEETNNAGTSKKGKKKGGQSGGNSAQADALLQLQKAEKPVFKETEPLKLRFGYIVQQPAPVVPEVTEITEEAPVAAAH